MSSNTAAWLPHRFADLAVGPAPRPTPGARELLVRTRAVAVNPLDVVKQSTGDLMYGWLPYPVILGEDVAGEVVGVGPGVSRFAAGDRVVAYAVGMEKGRDHVGEGAFQEYVVVREHLTAPMPDSLAFAEAAVLPLAVSTAASALFQADQLGLRHPAAGSEPIGEVVVVWGGSTSVGSNAIQLARAAGYDVITTASPRNHERARDLGAGHVVDYASPTAVADIVAAVAGRRVAGVLAIGTGSADPCVAIAHATGAKRVALASPSVSFDGVPRRPGLSAAKIRTLTRLVARTGAVMIRSRLRGIRTRFVWGSTLMDNEVGPMLWEGFLPAALADGRYVATPEPLVVGSGLESIQPALDALRAGVSAQKLVVTLGDGR